MSFITWDTKSGSLGAIAQLQYVEISLRAIDSNNEQLRYTHISGKLPDGLQVDSASGVVKGVPVIQDSTVQTVTSVFTVRASNLSGAIADRSFSLTVNNFSSILIDPMSVTLTAFDDGSLFSHQFTAISTPPRDNLQWSITNGSLPTDILTGKSITLTSSGLLQGRFPKFSNLPSLPIGYDMEENDTGLYDFDANSDSKTYSFTVMVTDGATYDAKVVNLTITAKDPAPLSIYPPVIVTPTNSIPVLTVGDKFSFKFDAIDLEDGAYGNIVWSANAAITNTGLTISSATGWISGIIPPQTPQQQTYTFSVKASYTDEPNVVSAEVPVSITTLKDSSNYITWENPSNLGTLINGSISEYVITAHNNAGKSLVYSLASGTLPSNLTLASTGEIVGRNGFEYFSIDNQFANISVVSTEGITVGMVVEGAGIAAGCVVQAVYDSHTARISPATHIAQGATVTFTDLITNYSVETKMSGDTYTTRIDGGKTTFDNTYTFSVSATTTDNTVSDTKQFTITRSVYNKSPYEELWIKSLLSAEDRILFSSIMTNENLFPIDMIYRYNDPNFGLADTLEMLFIPGLTVSTLSKYAEAMQKNHYNKTIKFGSIKTARALDAQFNVKYEVVYIDVLDDKENKDRVSAALSQDLGVAVPHTEGDISFTTIYPNSFENMKYRVSSSINYTNRGALPAWMTSRQEDGKELGLVRAIVLAYTKPGASKMIAYRLAQSGITFNDIKFTTDRYYLTSSIAGNYNPVTNEFVTGPGDITDKYLHYPQYGVYI